MCALGIEAIYHEIPILLHLCKQQVPVVELHNCFKYFNGNRVLVFTEYDDFNLSSDTLQQDIYQLLKAVKDMHTCSFVHRDIKPSNLLQDKINGHLVIANFGFVVHKDGDPKMQQIRTQGYFIQHKQDNDTKHTDQPTYDMVCNWLLYYLLTILSMLLDAQLSASLTRPTSLSMTMHTT